MPDITVPGFKNKFLLLSREVQLLCIQEMENNFDLIKHQYSPQVHEDWEDLMQWARDNVKIES